MKQVNDNQVRILYVETNEIKLLDIPRVLDEMGYAVFQASFEMKAQEFEQRVCKKVMSAIDKFIIHCVISYDFIPTIAEACMETGIPYIAWVYDTPQKELYTHYALYPCNYIFAFDREQVRRLQEIGIQHVYHMPLAVHVNKVKMVLDILQKKGQRSYRNDISFIGQLYKTENEESLLKHMGEELARQLYENIDACFMKWDENIRMHGLMSETCVQYFGELEKHKVEKEYPYMSEQFYYEAAFLSRAVANRERVYILNKLAEKYDVHFYTKDTNTTQLSNRVKIEQGMTYDVLTQVYQISKINLNITLHCIETGIPQRVFDVMAAGGFLLSNYQQELEELFVPGEDLVVYHNEQELEELVEYYLTHEEERERIARNGQKKVLREHGYDLKLRRAFECVMEFEKDREESYIILQSRELREHVDRLLAKKEKQAYEELYDLIEDKKYEVAIRKYSDLSTLCEMLECWKSECKMGKSCIFDDVNSLKEAEQKYLEVQHGLWRIEQGLSYERCIEVVERIRCDSISKFFVCWVIFTNFQERESTYVKLSDLLAEYNILESIELLNYGLLFLRGSTQMLIQKANLLMQLNMWKDALETLRVIEEILCDLECILGGECE